MTGNNPMSFFSDNVDAWGPLEWFDRLAKAVHARNRSVRDKDELSFELYQNIASSSATRLISDFEDKVRMALTTVRELEKANVAYVDANTELLSTLESLQRENEELRNLADRLKQEAQQHAMEARCANSTIAEIYQFISGSKGEPGNWNGAEPVRKYIDGLRVELAAALDDDWVSRPAYETSFARAKAADAEVKRLREALKKIEDGYGVNDICARIASEALASTGGEHNAE